MTYSLNEGNGAVHIVNYWNSIDKKNLSPDNTIYMKNKGLVDCHIHIENGPYAQDWINTFIEYALKRNIKEIYLLEHSHRFKDFLKIYSDAIKQNSYQKEWIQKKNVLELKSFTKFISKMRKTIFPLKIKWGLEICYIPEYEKEIKKIVEAFNWDFLTGSVHWISGWGFDHPRNKDDWKIKDINGIYDEYYDIMMQAVDSDLFDIIAHPDSIKCFDYTPDMDMKKSI